MADSQGIQISSDLEIGSDGAINLRQHKLLSVHVIRKAIDDFLAYFPDPRYKGEATMAYRFMTGSLDGISELWFSLADMPYLEANSEEALFHKLTKNNTRRMIP